MSRVTNIILSFSTVEDEDARIKEVNAFQYRHLQLDLVSADYNKDMEKGTVWYGGTKFLETRIYVGAFNYFDTQAFLAHVKQISWEEPEDVLLIIKEEWDTRFKLVSL